jgi:hypothetical protein
LAAAAYVSWAGGAPYQPADDALVLERIPRGYAPAASAAGDPVTAAAIAQSLIERARAGADPRFLGYAQAALAPWWPQADAPVPVLVMRATIRQARHDFDGALADLERVLEREPGNAQALLTRATVMRVTGRNAEAARTCRALRARVAAFYWVTCEAASRSLSGELAEATAQLDALALDALDDAAYAWWTAERADMAVRSGDWALALRLYRGAAQRGVADPLLLASQAQLLLDMGRAGEVLSLITTDAKADLLQLRRAQAARALGRPDAALETRLAENFAAARRRGEDLHLREEATFELSVRGATAGALALAQANWRHQREPEDARVLARAARAMGDKTTLVELARWQAESRLEDAVLSRLLPP